MTEGRGAGRQRIIDAATELFVTQGYAATTTRNIADRVGIRQPSLYAHFSVKSDILVEVLLQTTRPSTELARSLMADDSLTPLERIGRLVEFDVTMLCGGAWNAGLVGYLPEVRREDVGARVDEQNHELRAVYLQLVEAALLAGGRTDADAGLMTDVVLSMVEGVILRRVHNPTDDGAALAAAMRSAVLTILRG